MNSNTLVQEAFTLLFQGIYFEVNQILKRESKDEMKIHGNVFTPFKSRVVF